MYEVVFLLYNIIKTFNNDLLCVKLKKKCILKKLGTITLNLYQKLIIDRFYIFIKYLHTKSFFKLFFIFLLPRLLFISLLSFFLNTKIFLFFYTIAFNFF